jgi:hypothetical protein
VEAGRGWDAGEVGMKEGGEGRDNVERENQLRNLRH